MILRELFYVDPDSKAVSNNMEYNPRNDKSVTRRDDTRKTKLTLRQINQLRKASELHILEQERELEFVEIMYKPPATPTM